MGAVCDRTPWHARGELIESASMATVERDPDQHDALEDFERCDLTFLGQTRLVYVAGSGPAVIVMSEMPGIYPPNPTRLYCKRSTSPFAPTCSRAS